jgi:hypothetical protein
LTGFGEDLPRYPDGGARGRPAGVEGQVRDEFYQLVLRHPVLYRPFQVERQLVRAVERDDAFRCPHRGLSGSGTPASKANA